MDVLQLSNLLSSCCTTDNKPNKAKENNHKKVKEFNNNVGYSNTSCAKSCDNDTYRTKYISDPINVTPQPEPASSIDDNDTIWDRKEDPSNENLAGINNSRNKVEPKHQIYYKQSIDTYDITQYKSFGGDNSDAIIIKIYLPNCISANDIKLDVTDTTLTLETQYE